VRRGRKEVKEKHRCKCCGSPLRPLLQAVTSAQGTSREDERQTHKHLSGKTEKKVARAQWAGEGLGEIWKGQERVRTVQVQGTERAKGSAGVAGRVTKEEGWIWGLGQSWAGPWLHLQSLWGLSGRQACGQQVHPMGILDSRMRQANLLGTCKNGTGVKQLVSYRRAHLGDVWPGLLVTRLEFKLVLFLAHKCITIVQIQHQHWTLKIHTRFASLALTFLFFLVLRFELRASCLQRLYHFSHIPSSFFAFSLLFRQGLVLLPGLALNCSSPTSISQVAEITGVHHHAGNLSLILNTLGASIMNSGQWLRRDLH
jgi:hypothetical protein